MLDTDIYPTLRNLPVADLDISALNPRRTIDPDSIAALAASIRVVGLMQNLAGLVMGDGMTLIVAGGRRLRALQLLRASGEGPEVVPVLLTNDIAQAQAWAMAENTARSDLNVADEILAYTSMVKANTSTSMIAAAFGVSELHVQRRLKLATLLPAELDALRDMTINVSQAASLLVFGDSALRTEALSRAKEGWGADRLRSYALQQKVTARDRRARFIGIDAYRAAGGAITSDLFSSDVVIEDVAILDRLFLDAIEIARAGFITEGWRWAEFHAESYLSYQLGKACQRIFKTAPTHSPAQQERYADLVVEDTTGTLDRKQAAELRDLERALTPRFTIAQRAVAGLWFCVSDDGTVRIEAGYVRPEDQSDAIALSVLQPDPSAAKSPTEASDDAPDDGAGFTAALIEDLRAIRMSALQEALLSRPALARQLLAFGLAAQTHPFAVTIHEQPNAPKQTDGFTQAAALADKPTLHDWTHAGTLSLDDMTAIITNRLLRGIVYGFGYSRHDGPAWQDLLRQADPDLRARWRPTKENFWSRVTSSYLDQVYRKLFDLTPKHADARDFEKMKKGEKANLLHMLCDPDSTRKTYRLMTDTALARIDAWVPEFD